MHRSTARSVAAALRRVPPTSLAMLVALLVAIAVVELGWRDPSPGMAVDVPVSRMAEPLVERLRSVPLMGIDDPRAAAIASGVIFGRTEHVTASDEAAFLNSGLWHLLRGRRVARTGVGGFARAVK